MDNQNQLQDNSSGIRILIVDDHRMFIDGIKDILMKNKEFDIVGEALNGEAAIDFLENNNVDLVIADINMPGMSGTELTRVLKKQFPELKILILTMYSEREIIHDIVMSEAEGYILKNAGKQELLKALHHIADGGTYYCNEVIGILAENYVAREKVIEKTKDLSPRELEILKLVCQEYSTNDIAEKLFISPLTVETHRKNILKKTKTKTIVGLIRFAIENKLA